MASVAARAVGVGEGAAVAASAVGVVVAASGLAAGVSPGACGEAVGVGVSPASSPPQATRTTAAKRASAASRPRRRCDIVCTSIA